MKHILMMIFLLSGVASAAQAKNFYGTETWFLENENLPASIDIQGVKMVSFELGLADCLAVNKRCVLLSSHLSENTVNWIEGIEESRRVITGVAIVTGIDKLYSDGLLKRGKVYTGENAWYSSEMFDPLEVGGLKFDAIEKAISQCQMDGNQFCTFIKTEEININAPTDEDVFVTETRAKVRGYRFK